MKEKQRWEELEKKGKKEDQRRKKQRKKMEVRERVEKDRKVAVHCLFPMICGSRGSKSGLAQAAGAEPSGQRRDEQLHAALVRSTFRSKNVQNTSASEHLLKLRCRKSGRRCGAKHISKSTCTKHTNIGPLLEVELMIKYTPLWLKMHKTPHGWTSFGS
jgi:hypothetical protein